MENKPAGPPKEIKQIDSVTWELPVTYKEGMLVPARIIANTELMQAMDAGVFDQLTNLATLPGIQKYAFCMPDGTELIKPLSSPKISAIFNEKSYLEILSEPAQWYKPLAFFLQSVSKDSAKSVFNVGELYWSL